jgi:alkylglycerol monooxygenase
LRQKLKEKNLQDRIFGTFEAEHKDEKLAYGLIHPINTFDPIYMQVR